MLPGKVARCGSILMRGLVQTITQNRGVRWSGLQSDQIYFSGKFNIMEAIFGFFGGLIKLVVFLVLIIGVIAFFGYNKLRGLSELIREAWSNIGVAGRKQASLVNQLIDVVKGYQESEKFVMLKVSEDMSNTASVAQMYQQSGMVLSSVNGLAERFPELKSNQQYLRLIDSIQACESQLENARLKYNGCVRSYNSARSSIPTVFYAPALGFKAAPYLEFEGNSQVMDMGSLKSFSADDDGERINALLGRAGGKLLEVSGKAIEAGKIATQKAVEGGKIVVDKTQEKIGEIRAERQEDAAADSTEKKICANCGATLSADAAFCSGCGTRVAI
ncbi:MAG: LemA family protein [Azonexus sp.]|jgi:LemA protein|nr:LemA family protein [Azonexus sp.]